MKGHRRVFVGAVVLLISAQVVLLSVPHISGKALNALQLHGAAGFRDAALWLSMAYCSKTLTYSGRGPFVEVQHPANARPAINALGLRLPDENRGD
jgi:hypothetical protein